MKYVKKFEDNETFWIFNYISQEDGNGNWCELFRDEDSAKNFAVAFANESVANYAEDNQLKDEDYILTYEEIIDWLNFQDFFIEVRQITIHAKYELPEKIAMLRNTRKYNL